MQPALVIHSSPLHLCFPPPPIPPSSFAVTPPSRNQVDGGAQEGDAHTFLHPLPRVNLQSNANEMRFDSGLRGHTVGRGPRLNARSSRPGEYLPPTASARIVRPDVTWFAVILTRSPLTHVLEYRFLLHTISSTRPITKTRWGSINFHTMKFICPFPVPCVQFSKSLISLMAGH